MCILEKWKEITDNFDYNTNYGLKIVSEYLEFHSKSDIQDMIVSMKVLSELVNKYDKRILLQYDNYQVTEFIVSSNIDNSQILLSFGVDVVAKTESVLVEEMIFLLFLPGD